MLDRGAQPPFDAVAMSHPALGTTAKRQRLRSVRGLRPRFPGGMLDRGAEPPFEVAEPPFEALTPPRSRR